jgi:hypothetical protein
MYNNGGGITVGGVAGGGLAMTGTTGNLIWLFLAAFALIALGMALLRTLPRHEA